MAAMMGQVMEDEIPDSPGQDYVGRIGQSKDRWRIHLSATRGSEQPRDPEFSKRV